ncbi:MAG TPA: hypothetical protein VJV21_01455 [Pyrinomonadaceae bacterium]|nr:hypothetical protein [Pyrinomonadaceae bacterium]
MSLATEALIDGALASDGGLTSSFRTATRFFKRATAAATNAPRLSGQLTPGQFAAQSPLQLGDMRSLLARSSCSISARFSPRGLNSPAPA